MILTSYKASDNSDHLAFSFSPFSTFWPTVLLPRSLLPSEMLTYFADEFVHHVWWWTTISLEKKAALLCVFSYVCGVNTLTTVSCSNQHDNTEHRIEKRCELCLTGVSQLHHTTDSGSSFVSLTLKIGVPWRSGFQIGGSIPWVQQGNLLVCGKYIPEIPFIFNF